MILEKLVIPVGFDTGLLLEGIRAITGLISGAVDRTREWAQGLDALGDVTGMSNDKLAAWSFVARKAGVEIETLSSATVIMAKGLLDSTGELSTTGRALQDFGIDVLDANGKVRDSGDLMNDIGNKYAQFGTQTERVDFLTNIFGRSGAKLIDVFDTMGAEGGIDKVTQKVGDLGLVLDPTPYENFERNLSEINLTLDGLANAFVGPLLPGASDLLETFTDWLQSPWVVDAIRNIGETLGILASDIAAGIETGNWDAFFEDFERLIGIDIEPFLSELGKFATWVTDVGIPKMSEFVEKVKTGFSEFKTSSMTETAAIKQHWSELLDSIGRRFGLIFGGEGQGLIIDWQAIGITALQAIDLLIIGMTQSWEFFNDGLEGTIRIWHEFKEWLDDNFSTTAVYVPLGAPGAPNVPHRAAGGLSSGLTWVGERGPELVNLPSGSNVNNAQSSANMGFDYYKFAAILAVEFAKARD